MQNGDELVFLYQLADGYTNTSYACHIAALAGISSDLVQRGHEVCTCCIVFCFYIKVPIVTAIERFSKHDAT